MVNIGTAYIQIIPSFKGISENLKKSFAEATGIESIGKNVGKRLGAGINQSVKSHLKQGTQAFGAAGQLGAQRFRSFFGRGLTPVPGEIGKHARTGAAHFLNAGRLAATNFSNTFTKATAPFNRMINSIKNVAMTLGLPFAFAAGAVGKSALDMQHSLAIIDLATQATQKEIKGLTDHILDMGTKAGIGVNDTSRALQAMAQSGITDLGVLHDSVEDIGKSLIVTGSDAETTGNVVGSVMNTFHNQGQTATQTIDLMTTAFKLTGMSAADMEYAVQNAGGAFSSAGQKASELFGAMSTLRHEGMSASVAGSELKNVMLVMQQAMDKSTPSGKKLAETLAKNGVELKDSTGKMRPFNELIVDMSKKGMKATEMYELFGTRGGEAMAKLVGNTDLLQKFTGKMNDSTGATKKLFDELVKKDPKTAFIMEMNRIKGILTTVAMKALPTVIKAFDRLNNWLSKKETQQQFKKAWEDLGKIFNQVKDKVAPLFKEFIRIGTAIAKFASHHKNLTSNILVGIGIFGGLTGALRAIGAVFSFLAAPFKFLGSGIKVIIKGFNGLTSGIAKVAPYAKMFGSAIVKVSKFLGTNLMKGIRVVIMGFRMLTAAMAANPFIAIGIAVAVVVGLIIANWSKIKPFLMPLWNWMKKTGKMLWDGIKKATSAIVNFIKSHWKTILTFIAPIPMLIIRYWKPISNFFKTLWNGIKTVAVAVWNAIKTAWNAAKGFFSTLWNGIKAVATAVWNGIKTAVIAVWNGIKGAWNACKPFFTTLWNAIKSVATTVWNAIKTAVIAVWNGIKGAWNAAKPFFSALFNGIKSVATTVWNAIKTVATTVWNAIKSAWDVAKGFFSGLFNDIKSTAESVWNGIKNACQRAWDAIKNAVSSAVSWIKEKLMSMFDALPGPIKKMLKKSMGGASIDLPINPQFPGGGILLPPYIPPALPKLHMSSVALDRGDPITESPFRQLEMLNIKPGKFDESKTDNENKFVKNTYITVNAKTDADPYRIAKDIAWELK